MLRSIVFIILVSFSEWLWAGSAFSSTCCPIKPVKKPICPLQKRFYVDLGVSKTFRTHLPSGRISIIENAEKSKLDFGVYPMHRGTGIFPDTLQIGLGYAWLKNSVNQGFFPYLSVGLEYRQINAMNYPLTLKAKASGTRKDGEKEDSEGYTTYESIPLENSRLFATVKVNPLKVGCLFPYVSAGLGVSWTQAHYQQLTIFRHLNFGDSMAAELQLPAIKQTNLGFRFGSGLDFVLTQNLLMSIGYSYNHLGKLTVRKYGADKKTLSFRTKNFDSILDVFRALHLGNLTTHNVEFSLRYLFS